MSALSSLRYNLHSVRSEQMILPVALWALFAFIAGTFRQDPKGAELAAAFLGIVLPMSAGVLASSVLVGDPTLEVQFATKRPPWRTLLERLGILLALVTVVAIVYQVALLPLGVDITFLGPVLSRQLVWLAPTVSMMALSTLVSLIAAQSISGAMVIGGLWIVQLLLRDWFATSEWARYLFWYMGTLHPGDPNLATNQACLVGLGLVFLVTAALLLRRQERYI